MFKWILLTLFVLNGTGAFAAGQYESITIDWSKKDLEFGVTLVCDDLYQSGADVTIPGKLIRDFSLSIDASVGFDKCEVISKKFDGKSTTVRVDANEGCEFKVRNSKTKQLAIVSFASC